MSTKDHDLPHDSYGLKGSQERSTQPIFLSSNQILNKYPGSFSDPSHGQCNWKTLLSSGLTPSDSLTAGIATCPAKNGYLAPHRHEQAELYFILEGEGSVKVGDEERKVAKGDVVFIPGNAEHGIRNLRDDVDVVWFYCFAADKFEDVKYGFSGDEVKGGGSKLER